MKQKWFRLPMVLTLILVFALPGVLACRTPSPTPAPTVTATVTATPAPVPAPTVTATVTATPAPVPVPTVTATVTATPAPTFKLPAVIGWGAGEVGSLNYSLVAAMGPSLEKEFGVPVRAMPTGVSMTRMAMVREGEAVLFFDSVQEMYNGAGARLDFASKEWGPQKVRAVWGFTEGTYSLFVMGDSPARTIADLKGKRAPLVAGFRFVEEWIEGMLNFAGLSYADTVTVPTASWVDQHRAVQEGRTDFGIASPGTAIIVELEADRRSVRFLPLPAANNEGWARFVKAVPLARPLVATIGVKAAIGVEMANFPYYIGAHADADPELIYRIVKALDARHAEYKDKHVYLPLFSAEAIKKNKNLDAFAPWIWHEGSVRYLKELGMWKPEHEEWQKRMLGWELAVRGAWFDAVRKAETQGITISPKNQQWMDLWTKLAPPLPEPPRAK